MKENSVKEEKKDKKKFEVVKDKPKEIKKEVKEMSGNKKNKLIPLVIIFAILGIVLIFFSTIFALMNVNNKNIISGISIQNVEVSGLSKEEAIEKMKMIYDEKKEKDISVHYEDYEAILNPKLLEVEYNVEKAVDEAYMVGKNSNIFVNNYNILFSLIKKKNINVDMKLNEEIMMQNIKDIETKLPGIVIDSSYSVEDNELIITKGKPGIGIDIEKFSNEIKNYLQDIQANKNDIEISIINKNPEEINIEKIHEEVYKEVKDAYYQKNPFEIYPEVNGVDFDIEAAKKILAEDKEEYVIPLKITKAKVTLNQIGSEAFPDQLSTFTTRYDASDVNRTTNLIIACQKMNGKVLMPDEEFSYNKTLGARTAAAGFRNGKIYSGGEVVDGIGGGICQISSTLYNAVLMANLQIVERRNHQFVTSYLPAGRDATVVYGAIDFRFKNTRKYPVRIVASAKNGIATVTLYGIKEDEEYTYSFSTKTVDSIPFSTKYVDDSSLAPGEEKVKQKGANGIKTETYITKSLNGKVISTTLLSRDTYDAMARIVLKGIGEAAPVESIPVEEKNVEETPVEQPQTPAETEKTTEQPSDDKNVIVEENTNNTGNGNDVIIEE